MAIPLNSIAVPKVGEELSSGKSGVIIESVEVIRDPGASSVPMDGQGGTMTAEMRDFGGSSEQVVANSAVSTSVTPIERALPLSKDDVVPSCAPGVVPLAQGVTPLMVSPYTPCVVQCPRCTQVLSITVAPQAAAAAAVSTVVANPIPVPIVNMVNGPGLGAQVRQESPSGSHRVEGNKRVRDRGRRKEGNHTLDRGDRDRGGSNQYAPGRRHKGQNRDFQKGRNPGFQKGRKETTRNQQQGADQEHWRSYDQQRGFDQELWRSHDQRHIQGLNNRCRAYYPHCDHDSDSDSGSSTHDARNDRDMAWHDGRSRQGPWGQRSPNPKDRRNHRNPFNRQ